MAHGNINDWELDSGRTWEENGVHKPGETDDEHLHKQSIHKRSRRFCQLIHSTKTGKEKQQMMLRFGTEKASAIKLMTQLQLAKHLYSRHDEGITLDQVSDDIPPQRLGEQ